MNPITVSQVNNYIANKLRSDFNLKGMAVEGEISGLSQGAGHIYFTLKDKDSMIRCAIWKSIRKNIDESLLENGRQVVVIADISPYAKGGSYSLSVRGVMARGEGALMAEFNRVKKLLASEGLFDDSHKRPLPFFPERVGIITSSTGMAIDDIRKTILQRNDYVDLIVFPTIVQGPAAPQSIIENIREANRLNKEGKRIDILIVGRGGGSPEDLAAFSDEQVARAVFNSEIPVISAVGHTEDVSICDFTADVCAKTPTEAGKLITDTFQLKEEILDRIRMLDDSIEGRVISERRAVEDSMRLLSSEIRGKIQQLKMEVDKSVLVLRENNPQKIFSKGYAAVTDSDGKIISHVSAMSKGEQYEIIMNGGSAEVTVLSTKETKQTI
ncbi:exodeoxyribonuclease VII large subunit [Baileyella intestinalis]|uniref:exodeoxyribonuclease VII large subunit n=1 Tax=Baileyella intestinalis TaxID=2606709 RepID=UPI0022E992BA|nr:exodeoxyribonuclease VII large subunit [Baileyella intestinalis]